MRTIAASCLLGLLLGCAHSALGTVAAEPGGPAIELGESWPLETTLDHADLPDAADVWLELVRGARRSLDFAEFYASDEAGSRLEEIIVAIEEAVARGVVVRFLADETFASKYPDTLARFAARGVTVRRFDVGKVMGDVLHAKYFLVDGREAWVGSQNFDWRALSHIQELGVRLRSPAVVKALGELFQADWDVAGGAPASRYASCAWPAFPVKDGASAITLAASPKGFLCGEETWDLPILIRWIDEAKAFVKVQLLTYRATEGGAPWRALDEALRRAAARGVKVQLIVSSWNRSEPTVRELAAVPNVQASVLTIPRWSGGEIPYARVVHAKFMAIDGTRAWVGTSNWEGGYFTTSRNVSVFVEGGAVPARVARLFDEDAASPYTAPYR